MTLQYLIHVTESAILTLIFIFLPAYNDIIDVLIDFPIGASTHYFHFLMEMKVCLHNLTFIDLLFNFLFQAASEECAFKDLKERSSSLDSLFGKGRLPSPIEEGSEYSDTEDTSKDNEPECSQDIRKLCSNSIKSSLGSEVSFSCNSTYDSGYGISNDRLSQSSREHSEGIPAGWQRERRRMSMPCIRDTKLMTAQSPATRTRQPATSKTVGTRFMRSDAEIVRGIEDEIQQRISRRKQQIMNEQGGGNTYKRLHDRLNSRSAGHKLKRVLADMNNKRTTAELLQMADAKNSARKNDLYDVSSKITNFIKDS